MCAPECPSGMTDIGVSCQKDSYGRGVGESLGCGANEQNNAGLCYPFCGSGFTGNGPVCWGQCAAGGTDCGAACTDSSSECRDTITGIISSVDQVGVAVIEAGLTEGADTMAII